MPLPAPGTTPGDRMLDSPPPSPAVETGLNPGTSMDPANPGPLGGLVPPVGAAGYPPQVLAGVLQWGEEQNDKIGAMAQMFPDLAQDLGAVKMTLLNFLAKIAQTGAAPTSPNSTGGNFPGGGIDRGGMPAASGF